VKARPRSGEWRELRTQTGDTTIFTRAVLTLERARNPWTQAESRRVEYRMKYRKLPDSSSVREMERNWLGAAQGIGLGRLRQTAVRWWIEEAADSALLCAAEDTTVRSCRG